MPVLYVILTSPVHSRVYLSATEKLVTAEFGLCSKRLSEPPCGAEITALGGLPYLLFSLENEICERDIALVSRLSFAYGLFRLDGNVLLPLALPPLPGPDGSVSSMLKYTGKTNELFTRLLINSALFSSGFDPLKRLSLLDPMCGKGTTLFEGAISGYNTCGLELSPKPVHEAASFFKLWLERAKYKHSFKKRRLGPDQKLYPSEAHEFSFASSKEGMSSPHSLTIASGDARHADKFFRRNTFHAICADLPYGVQHESAGGGGRGSRNPYGLLEGCLPALIQILKPGGALALSWNTFLLTREKLAALLDEHGLSTLDSPEYLSFEHRVAEAIRRDLIVAAKPEI